MKGNLSWVALVFLLLAGLAAGKHKEEQPDPRLKQIHAIFLKGAFTAAQSGALGLYFYQKESACKRHTIKSFGEPSSRIPMIFFSYSLAGSPQK